MDSLLLDTDVIMDFIFNRESYSDHAEYIIGLYETKEVSGYVTPGIFSNA